jgi:hypothetical protein
MATKHPERRVAELPSIGIGAISPHATRVLAEPWRSGDESRWSTPVFECVPILSRPTAGGSSPPIGIGRAAPDQPDSTASLQPTPGHPGDAIGAPWDGALLDNRIGLVFVWLFQNLFHTRTGWTNRNRSGTQKARVCGPFTKAVFRTRTGDPPYGSLSTDVESYLASRERARSRIADADGRSAHRSDAE